MGVEKLSEELLAETKGVDSSVLLSLTGMAGSVDDVGSVGFEGLSGTESIVCEGLSFGYFFGFLLGSRGES